MRRSGCGRWLAGIVVALGALTARGDVEETEQRLKQAGVEEKLRERIHAAIAKGAQYLQRRQDVDGAFREPGVTGPLVPYWEPGITALCGLALAHTGTKGSDEATKRALEFLCPPGKGPKYQAVTFVYTAGIYAMLLKAAKQPADVSQRIVDELSREMDPATAWWDYGGGGIGADIVNLSTTQFAALGLWAGARNGARLPSGVWRRHLTALCEDQCTDGSWTYGPPPKHYERSGYSTGTLMGFANLVLARQALAGELEDDPSLCARSEFALDRARAALDRDGSAAATFPPNSRYADFYQLYALEKACTFADAERVGGVQWYVAGAQKLLSLQADNGGWGNARGYSGLGLMPPRPQGDVVSTAFALLFLLRVSETFHPTTPRDIVAPGPTTPGGEGAAARDPAKGPVLPPPPRAIGMSQAESALTRVEAWLKAQKADDAGALAALEDVAAAFRHLEPDPVAANASPASQLAREREFMERSKAWREHAGTVLVDAVGSRSDAVATRAARALSTGPRSASIPLRSSIDNRLRTKHEEEAPRAVVDAAFGALADLGHADLLPWLASRVTATREMLDVRATRAALAALAHFDGGERPARLAAARRIVRALAEVSARAANARLDEVGGRTDFVHWRTLQPHAHAALQALCADDAGEPPAGVDGRKLSTVAEFAVYLEVKVPK